MNPPPFIMRVWRPRTQPALLSYNIQAGIDTPLSRIRDQGLETRRPTASALRNLNLIDGDASSWISVGLREVDSGSLRRFVDMTEYLRHRGGYPLGIAGQPQYGRAG